MELFVSLMNDTTNEALVFEDDGRCAYAYWHDAMGGRGVLAHVWLYNRADTPDRFDKAEGCAPLNSKKYVSEKLHDAFVLPDRQEDIELRLVADDIAEIFVRGRRIGRVLRNETPGYAVHASAEGPAAKPLIASDEARGPEERRLT